MDAALNKNEAEANQINQLFKPVIDLLYQEGNPVGIKAVSQLLGLCEANLRLPLVSPSDALVAALAPYVNKLN
jgi:4-hydroxy-tetrahydrodipicolinate synthase